MPIHLVAQKTKLCSLAMALTLPAGTGTTSTSSIFHYDNAD